MCFRSGLIRVGLSSFTHLRFRVRNAHRNVLIQTRSIGSTKAHIDFNIQRLHASIARNNVADVHRYYHTLVEDIHAAKVTRAEVALASTLNRHQLLEMIDVLGASGRTFDLALIENILADMPVVFGVERTPDIQTGIIRALIKPINRVCMFA